MHYRQMKLAVGIFVLTFIVLFSAFVLLILQKKGTFEEKIPFHFYAQSAEPFHVGMAVRYSGFEIGSISHIALTQTGDVHVTFEVNKANHKWVCEDALLMLDKPLIGTPTIDVLSSLGYGPLEPGSTVNIIVRDDINDIVTNIEPLVEELQSIVTAVNTITTRLSAKESDLFVTLTNMRRFSDNLAKNDALMTTITGDEQSNELFKKALKDAADSLKQIHETSSELKTIVEQVQGSVVTPSQTSVKMVNEILLDIKHKLNTIDGTIEAIGSYDSDIMEYKDEVRIGLEKTNRLIDTIDAFVHEQNKNDQVILP